MSVNCGDCVVVLMPSDACGATFRDRKKLCDELRSCGACLVLMVREVEIGAGRLMENVFYTDAGGVTYDAT